MSNDHNSISENNTNGKTSLNTTIVGNPRPRKKEKAWCLLCLKAGRKSRLQLFQIGLNEAMYLCPEEKCPYPMNDINSVVVNRDLQELYHSMHPQRQSPINSTEKARLINNLPTSMPYVTSVETPKILTLSKEDTNLCRDSISSHAQGENFQSEKKRHHSFSRRNSISFDEVFANGYYTHQGKNKSLTNGHSKDIDSTSLIKNFEKRQRFKSFLSGEFDFEQDIERRLQPILPGKRISGNSRDRNRHNSGFPSIRKIDKTLMKVSGIELNKKFEPFTVTTKPNEKEEHEKEKTRSDSISIETEDNETKRGTKNRSISIKVDSIIHNNDDDNNNNDSQLKINGYQDTEKPQPDTEQLLDTQENLQQIVPIQSCDSQEKMINQPLEAMPNDLFLNQHQTEFMNNNDNNFHLDTNYNMSWPQHNNSYYDQQFVSPSHFNQFNPMIQPIMGPYQTDVIPPPQNYLQQQEFQHDPFFYSVPGNTIYNSFENHWHEPHLSQAEIEFLDSLNIPLDPYKDDLMPNPADIFTPLLPQVSFTRDTSNHFEFSSFGNSVCTDIVTTDNAPLQMEENSIHVEPEPSITIDTDKVPEVQNGTDITPKLNSPTSQGDNKSDSDYVSMACSPGLIDIQNTTQI